MLADLVSGERPASQASEGCLLSCLRWWEGVRESPSWGTHPIHEDLSPKGAAFLHHQMGDAVSTYESQGDRHSAARKGIFHKVPTKPDFFFLPLSFLLMWWSDSWEKNTSY